MTVALLADALLIGAPGARAQEAGTLRIDPPTQTVPPNANFSFNVIQSASVTTLGAELSLSFDASVLQLVDVQPGPGYDGSQVLVGNSGGGSGGTPMSLADGIAQANSSGLLQNLSFFFIPGAGSVQPGDNVFITVIMSGNVGQSQLQLSKTEMIDDKGKSLQVSALGGSVTVDPAAAAPTDVPTPGTPPPAFGGGDVTNSPVPDTPAAGSTAVASPTAAATPATAQSTVLAVRRVPLSSAAVFISPSSQRIAKEGTFTFSVMAQIEGSAATAAATIDFKNDLVKVVGIDPGSGWKATTSAIAAAISDGNNKGEMNVALQADASNPPPTSGTSTLLTLTMQGLPGKEGTSPIKLASVDVTDAGLKSAQASSKDGKVIVGNAGGGFNAFLIVPIAIVAVGILGGGAYFVRRRRMLGA